MLKKVAGFLILGGVLSACESTVPAGGAGYFDAPQPTAQEEAPVNLVPESTAAESADTLTASLESAINDATGDPATTTGDGAPLPLAAPSNAIATDDGSLNLDAEPFDQQIILREEDARKLAAARAQYVIIEPGTLPEIVAGVNIAAYARSTTNKVGERIYRRPTIKGRFNSAECRKYRSPDDAQRYFLANGGPEEDPLNLDPDGDGFACKWSPEPFRLLMLDGGPAIAADMDN